MRHRFLCIVIIFTTLSIANARDNSWAGTSVRFTAGISSFNMNYSGEDMLTMQLVKNKFYSPFYNPPGAEHIVAKKANSSGGFSCMTPGLSIEMTQTLGLMCECDVLLGRGKAFWGKEEPVMHNILISGGPYFYQESYRIYALGGIGVGLGDIFGYPSLLEDLQNGQSVSFEPHKGILNGNSGLMVKGALGIDYKLTDNLFLSLQYTYLRSFKTIHPIDGESLYVSSHNIGLSFGVRY